ncbi:LuxR C-terminal-related transcriptional regulator [Sporichthya polymorpha]|uniref:LuxR C-terminal-related transcriptional regulator n=1 Tax=Sporichthya polymorpha TaxID=35751 RepID=UPI000381855B|nr:LuxR C-terminal-related transcriptional regulator [Sporichthya polymorpha]
MGAATTAVVRQAVRQRLGLLQELTGLPVVFGGAVEDDGTGKPAVVISQVSGLRTPALEGLVVHPGTGLGGKAVAGGRAVVVDDYTGSRLITHEYDRAVQHEGLVSALAAPVRHSDEVVAVLYAASRSQPLGESAIRAAEHVARTVERDLEHMLPAADRTNGVPTGVVAELRAVAEALGPSPLRPRLERAVLALTRDDAEPASADGPSPLTTRQAQILRLVGDGLTNREIAERTGLADATVKTYVHDAMRRLEAHTRTRAVFIARSRGLL